MGSVFMAASTTAPETVQSCIVLRFNHFDPIWRRCWDREFHDAGRRFVSYRAIEEAWIDDAIASCSDGISCFLVEASWVLRHYLERHPEQLEVIRQLTREGRFELLGSGENIVDANMIHGELLARNLILGTLWAQQTLGVRPLTGWHSDGFGSSAQMPQIFRQCGYRWLPAISYQLPDAPYWRGLDGSTVLFELKDRLPHRQGTKSYVYRKLAPCPQCQGEGCEACQQRGFQAGERAEFTAPPTERITGDAQVVLLWGEELLPGMHVAQDIARFNASQPQLVVRQGTYRDVEKFIARELECVDNPPAELISTRVENNPSQSGCYVTRISIKQQHRAAEHLLLAAERWDAILAGGASAEALRDAWLKMTLSAFHDAVTSSHADPAYDELLDLLAGVKTSASAIATSAVSRVLRPRELSWTIFNSHDSLASAPVTVPLPSGWNGAKVLADGKPLPVYEIADTPAGKTVSFLVQDVPAMGARTVTLAPAAANVVACAERTVSAGRYTVEAGDHGITAIRVAGVGSVIDPAHFLFGEPILEHDIGDPWATRSLDRTRLRLSPFTKLQDIQQHGDSIIIRYAGRHPSSDDLHRCEDPMVTHLTWQQSFRLRAGVPWLEVDTTVEWYTHSRRLRLAFPSTTQLNRGVYEIPFGVLERDRYEGKTNHGGSAGGDWPAIHWAGIQAPDHTFAIFNAGTPSYRVEDGAVTVSILRSPQIPYALMEPEGGYVAHNYYGMTDHGTHHFRHALYIGAGDWRDNDTTRLAAIFSAGLQVHAGELATAMPRWELAAAHTQIATIKAAEDGDGLVVRLVEQSGRGETVRLTVPPGFTRGQLTNLLEEPVADLTRDRDAFCVEMRPWKIVTLRLRA